MYQHITYQEALVSNGEVENVSVCDSVEAGISQDHVNDQRITKDPSTEYETIHYLSQNQNK